MKLTQSKIVSLVDGVYTHDACKGLVYRVRNDGRSRTFVYRRTINGKRYDIGLGDIRLAKAESIGARYNGMTADEFLDSRQEKGVTPRKFEEVASLYIEHKMNAGDWVGKSVTVHYGYLKNHILPVIKNRDIMTLEPDDFGAIGTRLYAHPSVLKKVLLFCKSVIDFAKAKKWFKGDNPADKNSALKFLLPRIEKTAKHNFGALPIEKVPLFCQRLAEIDTLGAKCFLFSILTATRSNTVRLAKWDDIDLDASIWRISSDDLKCKANGGLSVPLSKEAVDVLRSIKRKSEYVFKGRFRSTFADTVFCKIIHDDIIKGYQWFDERQSTTRGRRVIATQHGIARACFMTWARDDENGNVNRYPEKVVHLCLHHAIDDGYGGAYERGQFYKSRIELMGAWGKFCTSKTPQKVPKLTR